MDWMRILAVWNRFGVMSATQEQRCGQNEVPLKNAACRLDADFELFFNTWNGFSKTTLVKV